MKTVRRGGQVPTNYKTVVNLKTARPSRPATTALQKACQACDEARSNWIYDVGEHDLVIALAARYRLPAVYPFRVFVDAGGLMCYGNDEIEPYRLAASYVDRILRGATPSELPVQTIR